MYSTKRGNTEKIAREISSELNCRCEKISQKIDTSYIDLDDFDYVFLGTGVYGVRARVYDIIKTVIEEKGQKLCARVCVI